MKPIIILGASSHAGKTTLVAGLCRLFANRGIKVAPFKSQNMSLNSFATLEGEEIARSTAVQAFAARQEPSVHMNPILLKPKSDCESQIIIHGRVIGDVLAQDYHSSEWYQHKLVAVQTSIGILQNSFDLIIAEGAGSCAEPNFQHQDLVNIGIARLLNADAYLTVDIDKGGAFADVIGTMRILELVSPDDRKWIKGIIINKFRGDRSILQPAIDFVQTHTGVPVVGVIPYLHHLHLEEEDRVKIQTCHNPEIDIAVVYLPHIANASDFHPLSYEQGVRVRFVRSPDQLGMPDLVILPGTKNTMWDLDYLRRTQWDSAIQSLLPTTPIMGICGGYEMMGQALHDPDHVESPEFSTLPGFGWFDFHVTFKKDKRVAQVRYQPTPNHLFSSVGEIAGYEIHCGHLEYGPNDQRLFISEERGDGAISDNPLVFGTFIHDVFKNALFTRTLIDGLRAKKNLPALGAPLHDASMEAHRQCDHLAQILFENCSFLAS